MLAASRCLIEVVRRPEKFPYPLGNRVQWSGERLGRSGLGEACPHGGEGAEASLEFVRLVGVAGPDARFELVEALRFTLDELLAFLVGPAAQLSQEGLTGVARPLEAESPGDGGEGAPLFAQGHGVVVGVAPRRTPRAAISVLPGPRGRIREGPVGSAGARQDAPG
jgi:hypothetical protein